MAEPKGFFRRIFSFGTSDRPEAERTPEHGQTPIPNDVPLTVTPGAPDADFHAPAAASTLADSEAGAQPEDGGGITPLTPRSSSETAEKKSPEVGDVEPAEASQSDAWSEMPVVEAAPDPAPAVFTPPRAAEPAVEVADPIPTDRDAPLPDADDADFSFLDAPSVPAEEPRADFSWLEEPVAPDEDEDEIEGVADRPFAPEETVLVAEDGGVAAEPAPFEADVASPTAEERDEFGWLDAPLPPEPDETAPDATAPPADPDLSDRMDVVPSGESPLPGVPLAPPLAPAPAGEGWRVREAAAAPVSAAAAQARWLDRLRGGLSRSSGQLSGQITSLFTKRRLDEATLQDFEDVMIQADLGLETAMRITDRLSEGRFGREISGGEVRRILAEEVEKTLDPVAMPLELDLSVKPHVILVVGVNGTGKTTTIGKLAAKLTRGGMTVTMAAGDTFRAAAVEQLKVWGERTGSTVVAKAIGADAAGLVFEAYDEAVANGSDVLIVDTAGRLQNKAELMAELEKIVRVLGRREPGAPHTVLQTLDATTGQNALSQVEIFRNVAGVNGLVMTKLDGTARGGILVAIAAKHRLPVFFVGVGEGIDDLEPFRAKDYAAAIAGTAV